MSPFTKGLAVGFAIAATVGPMWLLCLRRAVAQGPLAGFVSGLGVATADAMYGAVAAFGLTAVSDVLVAHRLAFGIVGSVFLCYLGVRAFVAAPPRTAEPARPARLAGAYLSTAALTLGNPMTILSFVAVAAGLGIVAESSYAAAAALVSGVFLGSTAWWALLSAWVAGMHRRITPAVLQRINRTSGIALFGFGAVEIVRLLGAP